MLSLKVITYNDSRNSHIRRFLSRSRSCTSILVVDTFIVSREVTFVVSRVDLVSRFSRQSRLSSLMLSLHLRLLGDAGTMCTFQRAFGIKHGDILPFAFFVLYFGFYGWVLCVCVTVQMQVCACAVAYVYTCQLWAFNFMFCVRYMGINFSCPFLSPFILFFFWRF